MEARTAAADAHDLQTLADLGLLLGDLLHETQIERGETALFVNSAGEQFGAELRQQYGKTDAIREEVLNFVDVNRDEIASAVSTELDVALQELEQIDRHRSDAIGLAVPSGELLAYYTHMNGEFLHTIATVTTLTTDADLRNDITAYVTFLNGKERSGIERAQLATVFSNDGYAPGQLSVVASLISVQDAYFSFFEELATDSALEFYQQRQADPVVADVARLETVALSTDTADPDFVGFGVDATAWFNLMTERIDLLKEVEDFQADQIREGAAQYASSATTAFWTTQSSPACSGWSR